MSDPTNTPRDDFPPHGYLDNSHHSWKLNPSGVLRSRVPAGMGWHVPNFGSYARNQFAYRAHLHVGLEVAGWRVLMPAEFAAADISVHCDLHTKNRLRYVITHPAGAHLTAENFLASEHAVGCRIELARDQTAGESPQFVRLWLALELAHNPATSRAWEHGLYSVLPGQGEPRQGEPQIGDAGLIGVCPEGDAWVIAAAQGDRMLPPSAAMLLDWAWLIDASGQPERDLREPETLQTATLLLAYDLTLSGSEETVVVNAALARGVSPDATLWAVREMLTSGFDRAYRLKVGADERFWRSAPRLSGDWPDAWRRGFATDLETLRMVTRPPTGAFKTRWDGMQIQAPRIVLAEAALDALALAWADPPAARELLLACFTSAPRPNVPCMREDGSYNMIADDGAICGTGPEWGWPFTVIDALWRRSGDDEWLGHVMPGAAAYLDWWVQNRSDEAGWLVHACSWESGQDVSTRFGEQSTGGSDVRHLRPVDLQAATAQAYRLLGEWSKALDTNEEERARWHEASAVMAERTQQMWRDGWFRDFDSHRERWSEVGDPMQLSPLACGLASPEQLDALRDAFDALPPHAGAYSAMAWPPVALTALEAALAAGLDERAGELAAAICERVWRRMDACEREADGALPGVTREYWPEPDEHGALPSAGIEGYGWGALTVHLLIRYVLGLREASEDGLRLVPALPASLRRPGAHYTIGPLAYGGGYLSLEYALPATLTIGSVEDALDITVTLYGLSGIWVARDEQDGRELARCEVTPEDGGRMLWHGLFLRPVTLRHEKRLL